MAKLLNVDLNAKTVKGRKIGYTTAVLYLAPARLSGFEVCPGRSEGCTAACLNTAGRGVFPKIQETRIAKTRFYFDDRAAFMAQLVREICSHVIKANKDGLIPCIRLNGTSDISWERVMVRAPAFHAIPAKIRDAAGLVDAPESNIMECFPSVQFYDYTKNKKRMLQWAKGIIFPGPGGQWPRNYHLTFSRSETNHDDCLEILAHHGNVAVVYRDKPIPEACYPDTLAPYRGCRETAFRQLGRGALIGVIDGDAHDVRFVDVPDGVGETAALKRLRPQGLASLGVHGQIIGLSAKGRAKRDNTGFVI